MTNWSKWVWLFLSLLTMFHLEVKVSIYIKLGVCVHISNTSILMMKLPVCTPIKLAEQSWSVLGSDLCDVMEGTDTTLAWASSLSSLVLLSNRRRGKESVPSNQACVRHCYYIEKKKTKFWGNTEIFIFYHIDIQIFIPHVATQVGPQVIKMWQQVWATFSGYFKTSVDLSDGEDAYFAPFATTRNWNPTNPPALTLKDSSAHGERRAAQPEVFKLTATRQQEKGKRSQKTFTQRTLHMHVMSRDTESCGNKDPREVASWLEESWNTAVMWKTIVSPSLKNSKCCQDTKT